MLYSEFEGEGLTLTVEQTILSIPSRWGEPARWKYLNHTRGSDTLVVVFPGNPYTLDAPLLWYAARAAADTGCDVLGIEYGFQANRAPLRSEELPQLVAEVERALTDFVQHHAYQRGVVISKSLGTAISSQLSDRLPMTVNDHIYLTPLHSVITFMRQAQNMLVVVGDQDDLFTAADIEQVSGLPAVELMVVPGANHALEIAGHYDQSLVILQQVIHRCGQFCAALR